MKCNFSLEHYKEILDLAKSQGYAFSDFFDKGKEGIIYLRHDIDIALDKAVLLARIEKEKGARATYFVQLDSAFYNPFEKESLSIIKEISCLGHDIGLHFNPLHFNLKKSQKIEEQISLCSKFFPIKKVVSFHKAGSVGNILCKETKDFVSTYSPYFFNQVKYISDSKGNWKQGCVCNFLKPESFSKIQLLTHPIWWGSGFNAPTDILNDYLKDRQKHLKEYLLKNIKTYKA